MRLSWALALLFALTSLARATVPVAQTFFVPFPETDFQSALKSIDTTGTSVGNSLKTVISIVVPTAGTVIVYDHWEDGYEADPKNPAQSSTQIWGDGNPANGTAPGYPSDILPAGAVITLSNNITMPRSPSTIAYDGRDRISATQAVAVTRAGWAIAPGTVLASATEVYDTRKWGTSFKIPVGTTSATQQQFEYTSLHIIAAEDGTVVQVDKDGNGTVDLTRTLNMGDTLFVSGGVLAGATVTATKGVEVHELTGDIGSSYESRTFAVRPTAQWASSYFAPVGTTLSSEVHNVYLYNPNASAITVSYETLTGSGTFSVAANGNYEFHMPMNSGAHFYTASEAPFYAVGANDAGSTAGNNQTHDWGYALLPETALTTSVFCSWAPGSDDLAAPVGVPDQNGSPIWVTPSRDTTLYVNYAGSYTTGPNTAPDGSKYDVSYTVRKLASQTIYNATTKDMTKARIYTTDGTTISAAWGEDPSKAAAGAPCLDMGTTIIPFPTPTFTKTATIVNDLNHDGYVGTGDTVEYALTLNNDGVVDLPNAVIEDVVPTGTTYVAGSTTLDGVPYLDDALPATIFPLDNGGLSLPAIPSGNRIKITFRVTVNPGATSVTNTASASSGGIPLPLAATVGFSVVSGSSNCSIAFTNSSGTTVGSYTPGGSIYVTVTDSDANTDTTTAQTLTAVVTDNTTGDQEVVTLTETGVNTGVFRNTAALPSSTTSGTSQQDGTLYAQAGDSLGVSHTDTVYGDVCTSTAAVSVPSQTKYLYLSDPAQALDRVDPVATNDLTTASTGTLGPASSTITVSSTSSGSNASGSSLTFSHTPGAGSNQLLLVAVGTGFNTNSGTAGTVSGVTYGGTAMTLVGEQVAGGTTPGSHVYIYKLLSPAAGPQNVVVSTSANSSITAGATTFNNVNQTTPLGTFVPASASTSSPAPSATVTSATGELVYSACAIDYGSSVQTITTNAGQTELFNFSSFTYVETAASTKPGAASVTVGYSAGDNTQEYGLGAVAIKPAPGASSTTATFTQSPAFTSAFTLPATTTPSAVTYFTTSSGSMPPSPSITAVLKHGATTFATSNSVTSDGTKLTFGFPALGSAVNISTGEAISMTVTTAETGVIFTIDYDSTNSPSKITLPTNTVIQIPSYHLYDAAYPNGSIITSIGNGQTVYARASVTDPFGTSDISGLNVLVSDSGGPLFSTVASSVSDNGTTKIYEYAWLSGPNDGAYTIKVTANEGTEGINATSTLPIQVTSTDNGTPSTTTFTDASGTKVSSYTTSGPVYVQVVDRDQNTNTGVAETVTAVVTTANGDRETITLTETGVNTGIFRSGPITTNTSAVTQGNSALNVIAGTGLHVVYIDPDDSSDTSSDNASIAATGSVVSAFKTLLTPASGKALVGDTVTYNIQVTNPGTSSLATVSVADTFPSASLQFLSASIAPTTQGSGTLNWSNVGPLSAGSSVSLQVSFTALAAGATVTNSATIGGTASFGPTTASVQIENPKVTVTKTVLTPASGPAYVGDNMTWRIVVQNSGSTNLTTVPLQDSFPGASLQYVSATTSPDSTGYGSLVWNNIGPINTSSSKTIDVTFKVLAASASANNTALVNNAVDASSNSVPNTQSTASLQLVAFNLSGNVFDDANGLSDATVNGSGTNAGGTLYANLLDNTNTVVQVVAVAADGTYSFSGLSHNTTYGVLLNTIQGTVGDFTPAVLLPSGWVNTGENIGPAAGDDSSPDGFLTVAIASADVTDANFGIEQEPAGNTVNAPSQTNPGNSNQVTVPALGGSDPEDPAITTIAITSLPTNGTLYYNNSPVTLGQVLSGYDPSKLKLDPDDGSITVSFSYAAVDAAGIYSPDAAVNMPFVALTLSGNVFNDNNALTDNTVNGSGTDAGGSLWIALTTGGVVVDNAQVAADGTWSFGMVVPNTLYKTVLLSAAANIGDPTPASALPANYASTGEHLGAGPGQDFSIDGVLTVSVTNSSVLDADFGIIQTGTVSGHLYIDTNGDGAQAGEPDLANVNVVITDHNGNTYIVATDASGNWSASIPVGTASVHVDNTDPDYPAGATQTQGSEPTALNVVFATTSAGGVNGYYVPAVLTGHLYVDTNGNGAQDPGEPNLPNVTVNITNSNGDPQTAVTDANGDWTAQVPPGATLVSVDQSDTDFTNVLPATFQQTEGTDPNILLAVTTSTNDVGSFGYFVPGTVSGHLYVDTNGNGVQDPGESNLINVPVVVTDSNSVNQTVFTDFNGSWAASVPPGSTSAKVDTSSGQFIANVPGTYVQTQGTDPTTVTAVANTDTFTDNDGFFVPAVVTGHLYIDTNGNGTQDGGEPSLPNVDVVVVDSLGSPHTVTTDGNGDWSAAIPPGAGTAKVKVSDPDFTSAVAASYVQSEGTNPTPFTAVSNTTTFTDNDGYFVPAMVSGHLYVDTNGNSTQDPGEPNLPNVDVIVTDSNNVSHTVTTDTNGDWSATFPPGSTSAKVDTTDIDFTTTVPAGYVQTEGTDPTVLNAVADSSTAAGNDGYFIPAIVTGHLYIDTNGNGVQDGAEPNLASVDVVITDSNNNTQTVTTNASGNWTASVPPGSTSADVDETDPQFPAGSTQTQGTDPTVITAVANVTTPSGPNGYFIPSSVTGHLYIDTNGNGAQDPGEPDLVNVDVIVTDSNNVAHTVATDGGGNWIAAVPPGPTSAKVDTTDTDFTTAVPAGYVQTEGDDPTVVTAVANTSTSAGKDGYFIPATVSGHLYVDSNGNGAQDANEPNLPNVDVVVTDSNNVSHTVTTDSSGIWTVAVPPGATSAKVSTSDPDFTAVLPAGYNQTEGDDPTTVTAVANATTPGGTDGFHPAATHSITGQVRFDSDRNGNFLDNDRPLPNFTLKLYFDANDNSIYDPGTDILLETQVTGADGNYTFAGYPNGSYLVIESPPDSALLKTNDRDGNNDRTIPVNLSGADSSSNDFLEFADPQGWFYDTETGTVIPGGSISITSVPAGGAVNIILDGSSGEYSWLTNGAAGDYVMTVTPPPGYTLDPTRPANPAALVPSGHPDPYEIGSNVNLAGTDLQDFSAATNPWYLTFTLQPGDPRVLYNNIPLLRINCPVSFNGWKIRHPLGGQNGPTDNPDGDAYTNLEEYAFCFDPSSGVNSVCPLEVVVNAGGTIDAVVRRVIGVVGLTYELEYITDLGLSGANGAGWTTINTISPVVVDQGDGTEKATYQNLGQIPALASGQGFLRIKLTESSSSTTVRTKAAGWSTRALTIGCQSCGAPFLNCPVFSGTVDGVAGNVVDVTTAAGGQSVAGQFMPGKQYFIEVVSGDNAGHRWEIDEASSTPGTIAIDLASTFNTQATLPANLAADRIAIYEHVTMKDVFPPASFHATNFSTTADRILISAPGTGAYTVYWLFNNGGSPKWVDAGNATLADVGGTVLDNCQGVYIHPKFAPVSLALSGQVRQNVAACPLKAGPNMVTGAWPMDQSPASRALTFANGFTGNPNPLHADKVLFWAGDDTAGTEAYISHFEMSSGARHFLTEMSDAALNNEDALPIFKALRASFIQSVAGKPDWVMPLPWTP